MASIYIRDVDPDVVYKLRRQALDKRMSFKDFCLGLLTGERNGNQDHDIRGAGSGKAGKAQRSGDDASVSDVRQAAGGEKRLYPLQPSRGELDRGNGLDQAPTVWPCPKHPGKSYNNGGKRGCIACERGA